MFFIMPMSIQFKVVTPAGTVYEDVVDIVTLPSRDGEISILPNHIPLVSLLRAGVITLKKNREEIHLSSSGGFVEILPESRVIVLADTAERADDLVLEKIEEAKKKAEEALNKIEREDEKGQAMALAALQREVARIRAIKKRKDRH